MASLIALLALTGGCAALDSLIPPDPPAVGTELRDYEVGDLEVEPAINLPRSDELIGGTCGVDGGERYYIADGELSTLDRYTAAAEANTKALRARNKAHRALHQAHVELAEAGRLAEREAQLYRDMLAHERRAAAVRNLATTGLLGGTLFLLSAGSL